MAQPRHVIPGATYLITRRCYQRTCRLRPSPQTNAILRYCLALAARKTGVVLLSGCGLSNHHHLVVRDVRGELPTFLREFHRTAAKALNASQGQWENLWSAEHCNVVRLVDDHDIADKIAYCAANPVEAGLVAQPEDWPGMIFWEPQEITVTRPDAYFDPNGDAPESLTLRVESPVSGQSREAMESFAKMVREAIARKVAAAHEAMARAGRKFVGKAGVLAKSFMDRAKSREPKRMIVPEVAAKDPAARTRMLAQLRQFRTEYREALEAWKGGDRDVVFPAGTWWMRVHHHAQCDEATLVA